MFAGHLLKSRVHEINFRSVQVVHNTYDIAYDSRGSSLWNNLPREIEGNLSTKKFKKTQKEHGALLCSFAVCK